MYAVNSEWDEAEFWLKKGRRHADAAQGRRLRSAGRHLTRHAGRHGQSAGSIGHGASARQCVGGSQSQYFAGVRRPCLRDVTTPSIEHIDNFVIDDFLRSPAVEKEIKVSRQVICGKKKLAQSAIWLHYENDGQQYAVIHWCDGTGKNQTGKGIGKGAVSAAVMEAYGTPQRVLPDQGGTLWVYPGLGLLFSISRKGGSQGGGRTGSRSELKACSLQLVACSLQLFKTPNISKTL